MPTQTKFICPSGVTNVDFSGIFAELNGGAQYGTATNFKVGALDLTGYFHASTSANDRPSFNTGYKVSSTDLSAIFRRRGYVEDPVITAQPATVTRTTTQSATFTVQFTCTTNVNYQWKKDAINIVGYSGTVSAGSQTLNYPINSVAMGDQGNYTITLTGLEVVSTNNARLNISPRIISTADAPGTYPLFYGTQNSDTLDLQITSADGETPLSYQWFKNAVLISGATASQYTKTIVNADSGTYIGVVTNAYGTATTGNFIINALNGVPTISSHPSNQIVNNNTAAAFSVSASANGAALSYQWKKDNVNIPNENSPSYSIPTATTANDGSYTCYIDTTYGSITSNAAISRIKPYIATQPIGGQFNETDGMSLTVIAGGSATLSYQWSRNGTAISGATSSSYPSTGQFSLTPATAGTYTCKVISTHDSIGTTSNGAVLAITSPVVSIGITTFASPFIFHLNTSVTLTATPTQGANIAYQWYGPNGAISGATNINYIFSLSASNDGSYYVVATNGGGSYTSNTINVYVHPYITTNPSSATVYAGTSAVFTVVAQGSGSLSYQWYRDGTAIVGATLASHSESTTVSSNQSTAFYCVVSSAITNVTTTPATSTTATLTVNLIPLSFNSVTTGAVSVTAGNSITFTAANANGSGTLAYQWLVSTNGGSSYSAAGASGQTYTLTGASSTQNGYWYTCQLSSSAASLGSLFSTPATLTVNYAPIITDQPDSVVLNNGNATSFTVAATAQPAVSAYQWQRSTNNGSSWANLVAGDETSISGITGTTLTFFNQGSRAGYQYRCAVTNSLGTTPSNPAILYINPYIITNPSSTTVNAGGNAVFAIAAGGSATLTYLWYRNGSPIGASDLSFADMGVTSAYNGYTYYCVVSSSISGTTQATSTTATLTVEYAPTLGGVKVNSTTVTSNLEAFGISNGNSFNLEAVSVDDGQPNATTKGWYKYDGTSSPDGNGYNTLVSSNNTVTTSQGNNSTEYYRFRMINTRGTAESYEIEIITS